MRKLTLKDNKTIFKLLAVSKILYVAIITKISITVIEELRQIQSAYCGITEKLN